MQLFGLIAFSYCFLIKKGKKQQKLQSCKVAKLHFCNFMFFFQKILAQKNLDFFVFFFWIAEVWVPEALSLFFGGLDPNSFYVRNPIPIFFFFGGGGGGVDLNSFYFRNSIPIFWGGLDLNSFYFRNLIPIFFWVDGSQQFSFQKPSSYFFLEGIDLNSFHFRNLLPIFFGGDWSQQFSFQKPSSYFLKWKLLGSIPHKKNRGKASEMQTVEMKALQKIGGGLLKCKLLRWKPYKK